MRGRLARPKSLRQENADSAIIEVKTVTWSKDSHGLFDYENPEYEMSKFKFLHPAIFYRHNNEIKMCAKAERPSSFSQGNGVLSISQDPSSPQNFFIDVPGDFGGQRGPLSQYLIVRSLKSRDNKTQRGLPLCPGQVVKLGRVEYRVLEVCSRAGEASQAVQYSLYQQDSVFDVASQNQRADGKEPLCRFCYSDCLGDVPAVDNLMLYMCDCKGSAGGIHFACLRTWINYKIVSKNQFMNITSYKWKKLECDICKRPYPRKIAFDGEVYEFLAVQKPAKPYIIIEKLVPEVNFSSDISIISLEDQQEVKLGRGHLCDLRVSDISVSRFHAYIRFMEGNFVLFDNNSKFGSLVLLDKSYPISAEKAAVQIGRTVFTFVLKQGSET